LTDRTTWRTWDDFWGDLILVRFPESNPELWDRRQAKAEWVWHTLGLWEGARVLDLGCGDGKLDICLARQGAKVTAMDRLQSVLDHARAQASEAPVTFECGDLRSLQYPDNAFEVALLFEVTGLMSRSDDNALIVNIAKWLQSGGRLGVDCPRPPDEAPPSSSWDLPEGRLTIASTYDPETRLRHLDPTFRDTKGNAIRLCHPHDPSKPDHTGVLRYHYPKTELTRMMTEAGFRVRSVPHHSSPENYFLLVGEV